MPYDRNQHTTRALTDDLQISTAMAGAMCLTKRGLQAQAPLGCAPTGSARIADLTKAQIQFKLLALGIRNLAPEATGERRARVEIQGPRQ